MTVDRAKVLKYIDGYQRRLKPDDDQRKFYLAVCQVQLRDYAEAQQLFEKSCNAMFGARPLWKDSGQPHWLVDICVLSGRTDLYPKVLRELDAYKTIPLGRSLVALYAYALMELLLPSASKDSMTAICPQSKKLCDARGKCIVYLDSVK
jgi:hypothetical protein